MSPDNATLNLGLVIAMFFNDALPAVKPDAFLLVFMDIKQQVSSLHRVYDRN
jgi:hypothetical protein